MRSPSLWMAIALALIWQMLAASASAAEPSIDFAHEIVPILRKHCVACHGGEKAEGGFSLNTRELLLESEAAVPGKAEKSRLIELVASQDPQEQMPPKDRPRVSAAELAKLKAWVEQGMAWEAGFSFAERRYEPPLRPRRVDLPPVVDGRVHPIDRLIDAYLQQHKLPRPATIDDAAFLRRASLDIVGLLPSPERLQQYAATSRAANTAEQRERFVRECLDDDIAYAEHWLTFWNDLLRNDYAGTGFITGGRKQISDWLYRSLLENKPYDQMVRELITPGPDSEGFIQGIRWRGEVSASQRQEIQFAQNASQAFLGINLKCASCHDSFIDRWKLEETYALAQTYATQSLELHRCDKPLGTQASAAWLFPELGQIDAQAPQPERMKQLAALMTHRENGRLTRTIVNRLWHRLMGRGIVHPVDAMHTEPWNADLLDFLAVDFAEHGYDLKHTIELICTSQAYQSKTPPQTDGKPAGKFTFRGPLARRMTAEQFMDAVWQITKAAPNRFDAPVQRFAPPDVGNAETQDAAVAGQWIGSKRSGEAKPAAGEAIALRYAWEVKDVPVRAVAAIAARGEYTLYLNGARLSGDAQPQTVEVADLGMALRRGKNELLVIVKAPAGEFATVLVEAGLRAADGAEVVVASGSDWQWSPTLPDARGAYKTPPTDWQDAAPLEEAANAQKEQSLVVQRAMRAGLASESRMVRASLLKNNAFLTALGRPTRDQIVSMRPDELTTLEAIDLANGQVLADAAAQGARRLVAAFPNDPEGLVRQVFVSGLSREPTADELQIAVELLRSAEGPQPVEDLLWSVFMLPEFQLVR